MGLTKGIRIVAIAFAAAASVACGGVPPTTPQQSPTWQAVDIPNLPSGLRGVAYDQGTNSIWILTRYFEQAGHPLMMLTRMDLGDRSAMSIKVPQSAAGFIRGSVEVDGKGDVWMAWGRVLVSYSPTTHGFHSWTLPAMQAAEISPQSTVLDGNVVSMSVGLGNEVWLATHSEHTVVGFNPTLGVWDRRVHTSVVPTLATALNISASGALILNGVDANMKTELVDVDITSGREASLKYSAVNYVVTRSGEVVYEDDLHALGRLTLSADQPAQLASPPEIEPDPHLSADTNGNVWFSLVTASSVGVGRMETDSGALAIYPFPPIPIPSGAHEPCPGTNPCNNSGFVIDPDIQSIVADNSHNIWVVTGLPGSGDPSYRLSAPPIYELVSAY